MINESTVRRLGLVLAALTVILLLFIPTFIFAQGNTPPPIPHKLENRGDCLSCHQEGKLKSPKIPEDHAGRTNDMCQDCHHPAGEAGAAAGAPQANTPPPIPHTLENRDDCLSCLQDALPCLCTYASRSNQTQTQTMLLACCLLLEPDKPHY